MMMPATVDPDTDESTATEEKAWNSGEMNITTSWQLRKTKFTRFLRDKQTENNRWTLMSEGKAAREICTLLDPRKVRPSQWHCTLGRREREAGIAWLTSDPGDNIRATQSNVSPEHVTRGYIKYLYSRRVTNLSTLCVIWKYKYILMYSGWHLFLVKSLVCSES